MFARVIAVSGLVVTMSAFFAISAMNAIGDAAGHSLTMFLPH